MLLLVRLPLGVSRDELEEEAGTAGNAFASELLESCREADVCGLSFEPGILTTLVACQGIHLDLMMQSLVRVLFGDSSPVILLMVYEPTHSPGAKAEMRAPSATQEKQWSKSTISTNFTPSPTQARSRICDFARWRR